MREAPYHAGVADGPASGMAVWARTSDGIRIRVGLWPRAGARGTVLLFPGRTEYIEKYGRAAADLARRGYATLAVDWRGQGLADRLIDDPALGHIGDFTEYQHDVATVLAVARDCAMPQPWHLLAHSMGGCIGLRALMNDLPVASATFTAPMWGIALNSVLRMTAWTLGATATTFGHGQRLAPGAVAEAYVIAEPFEDNKLTRDQAMYDYMRRQIQAEPRFGLGGPTLRWLWQALKEIQALELRPAPPVPCLTFLGGHERIVNRAQIEAWMARWPDGRIELLPGAEHEVMMETPDLRARIFDEMAAHFDAHATARARPA